MWSLAQWFDFDQRLKKQKFDNNHYSPEKLNRFIHNICSIEFYVESFLKTLLNHYKNGKIAGICGAVVRAFTAQADVHGFDFQPRTFNF